MTSKTPRSHGNPEPFLVRGLEVMRGCSPTTALEFALAFSALESVVSTCGRVRLAVVAGRGKGKVGKHIDEEGDLEGLNESYLFRVCRNGLEAIFFCQTPF